MAVFCSLLVSVTCAEADVQVTIPDDAPTTFEMVVEIFNAAFFGASLLLTVFMGIRESRSQQQDAKQRELARAEMEKAQYELEMVQLQIGQLFGPLKGLLTCCEHGLVSARMALKQKRLVPREKLFLDAECSQPNPAFRWFEYSPEGEPLDQNVEIVQEWRLWVREVILPCDEEMLRLIKEHTHLLPDVFVDTSGLPKAFTDAMEHFLSYRVLVKAWDLEEGASGGIGGVPTRLKSYQNTATVSFPREFPTYVNRCWADLMATRDRLMRITRPERASTEQDEESNDRRTAHRRGTVTVWSAALSRMAGRAGSVCTSAQPSSSESSSAVQRVDPRSASPTPPGHTDTQVSDSGGGASFMHFLFPSQSSASLYPQHVSPKELPRPRPTSPESSSDSVQQHQQRRAAYQSDVQQKGEVGLAAMSV